MKYSYKYVFILTFLLLSKQVVAQDEINLSDLKTPNSPGFQLLDISPSNIERPTNPKAFALGIFNLTNNGTTIPKNFSFEISPYWFTKPSDATVYKYLNIKKEGTSQSNVFSGIYNKLSASIASSFSDSTAGSLLKNTNYISFGLRTNLITIRTAKQHSELSTSLSNISIRIGELKSQKDEVNSLKKILTRKLAQRKSETDAAKQEQLNAEITIISAQLKLLETQTTEDLEKKIDSDEDMQKYLTELNSNPLFQLDAAYAYSQAFSENIYSKKRFNRGGLWLNAAISGFSFNQAELADNLSFTASLRFMKDNLLVDTLENKFQEKNAIDYGGKLEYEIKQFSLSVEYLKRNYSDDKIYNSERTVGILQYKVSDHLYIIGTFGKNFGEYNNVFTLLGLNWGFGKSSFTNE